MPWLFVVKNGWKIFSSIPGSETGAAIAHAHAHTLSLGLGGDDDAAHFLVGLRHRIHRVEYEVKWHLLKLHPVGEGGGLFLRQLGLHHHVMAYEVASDQLQDILRRGVQVERLSVRSPLLNNARSDRITSPACWSAATISPRISRISSRSKSGRAESAAPPVHC